jgi:hypothetical protein
MAAFKNEWTKLQAKYQKPVMDALAKETGVAVAGK